ncbi:MAG: L,D-transpeptidase [Hydrogenophaga sp.]|nr:L,D-transpeptidase [Hydrogenophaga sp.]
MRFSFSWPTAALWVALLGGPALPAGAAPSPTTPAVAASALARQVMASADHAGLPFAVVDKKAAVLTVYLGNGQLVGYTPVLLGADPGDRAVPGVGDRTQSGQLRKGDRVTTAGRFVSEPGRNLAGEAVVWIDYDSALAIHRLRPGRSQQNRATRLASADPQARRVSDGCVVVPVAFYEAVVAPVLGRSRAVVYVMPEAGGAADQPLVPSDA